MKKLLPSLAVLLVWFTTIFNVQAQEPVVDTYFPGQNAPDVALDVELSLNFINNIKYNSSSTSKYIKIVETNNPTNELLKVLIVDGVKIDFSGSIGLINNTLTLTPSSALEPETQYSIIIPEGALEDFTTSTPFSGIDDINTIWRFTTVSRPAPSSKYPVHNAIGVTGLETLTLTYNEEIAFAPNKNLNIYKTGGTLFQTINTTSNPDLLNITLSGTDYIIEISHEAFAGNQEYYVNVDEGFVTAVNTGVGSAGIAGSTEWSFTTVAEEFSFYSIGPASTPEGIVHANTPLSITYSEAVTLRDNKNVIIYYSGTENIFQTINTTNDAALFSYDPINFKVTISHDNFPGDTSFDIEVEEGLVTADDNNIASEEIGGLAGVWSFRTAAPPSLQSVTPINGATNVSGNQLLEITYDQDIVPGNNKNLYIYTATNELVQTINTQTHGASFTATNNSLSISHDALPGNTQFYILMDEGLALSATTQIEAAGISSETSWTFTTTSGPQTELFTPAALATGVSVTAPFAIDFNENIAPGAIGNITIRLSDETLVEAIPFDSELLTFSNDILTINHSALTPETTYHIQIDNNVVVSDATGTPWEGISDQSWSFTTAGAPSISSYYPENGELSAPVNQPLVLTFSEYIKRGNTGYLQIRKDDGTSSGMAFKTFSFDDPGLTFNNNELTITHDLLQPATTYFVKIDNGVILSDGTDVAFEGISDNNQWRFTTAEAPTTLSFDPANASVLTSATNDLVITFSENIELGTSGALRIKYATGANETFQSIAFDNTGNISIINNVMSISHLEFPPGESYFILIDAGFVRSTASGVAYSGIQETSSWTFTSPSGPVISTYQPVNNSIDIPVDAELTLTFDQPIAIGTGNMILHDELGGNAVTVLANSSQIAIVGNDLIFSNLDMPHEETLYVTMDAGFVKSADTGFAFAGITDVLEWTFTTLPEPPAWTTGYPVFNSITTDNINLDLQTNINALYYFVISDSEAAPTVEQIAGGLLANDVTAPVSGNGTLTGGIPLTHNNIDISGLTSGVNYYMHLVAKHPTKDLYSKRTSLLIDKVAPVTTVFPADGTDYFPEDGTIKITFNEKIFNASGVEYDNTNLTGLIALTLTTGNTPVAHSASIDASGREITVTPSVNLDPRTNYTITANQVYDLIGNGQIAATTTTFTTNQVYTWTGGGTGATAWSDPANWEGQPQNGFTDGSVYIPNTVTTYPEISTNTSVHNLNIEPGAVLTHSAGTLVVTGELRLQSTANVNASYIYIGGTLSVADDSVKIEQAVSANNRNYNIASPTSGASKTAMGVTNNLYKWNNSTGLYETVGESEILLPGKGYIMRSEVGKIIFSGSINQADVNIPVSWSPAGKGWHLVGNPFTASIDWVNITKNNVADGFWLWDNNQSVYGVYNQEVGTGVNLASSVIPSNHSFFVKVPAELRHLESSITFEIADAQTNQNSYLKSASSPRVLKIAGSNGEVRDETAIVLHPEASDDLDHLDTEKMFAKSSQTIELYTPLSGPSIAINAIPNDEWNEKIIPLGYFANNTGSYLIEVTEMAIHDIDQLLLTDHIENEEWLLTEDSPYAFSVDTKGTNESRFTLKLVRNSIATANQQPEKQDEKCLVYSQHSQIVVETPKLQNLTYQLNDMSGRILENGKLSPNAPNRIDTPNTGVYVLTIMSDQGKEQHKVAVE
ncbi:Ig-like domain-containing protein [Marinilabilia sp.]|uniref:Ig-like domain-containing protein n=1 Tax=Marinilabilia sp. TaxID=2021252 RepID=UPI0025C67FAB|nr:Ig-like domain-containing protein [Marinilabilia sp.]